MLGKEFLVPTKKIGRKQINISICWQTLTSKQKRDRENFQLIQEAVSLKRKKPWLASALSLIPGLGYVYTRRPKSALTAFVMNSLLGYAVFTSIRQRNYGTAALLGVFNLSFYIGNISGSNRSASQYNQRKLRFTKDANITLFKYVSIADALQKLLHKKIDLVEEGQLKDFAKDSAEQDKILIYEREA